MIPFYIENGNPITDKAAARPGSEYVHIHFGTSNKIIALSVATNNIQYPRAFFYITTRIDISEAYSLVKVKIHNLLCGFNNIHIQIKLLPGNTIG